MSLRFIVKAMVPEAMPGPNTLAGMCLGPVDFSKLDREGQPVRIRLGATVADVRPKATASGLATR